MSIGMSTVAAVDVAAVAGIVVVASVSLARNSFVPRTGQKNHQRSFAVVMLADVVEDVPLAVA